MSFGDKRQTGGNQQFNKNIEKNIREFEFSFLFSELYPILEEMKKMGLPIKKADHKFTYIEYSTWPNDERWELQSR